MKAISLWEPWATLMALGLKTIETRHWPTKYKGDLLICAAKGGLTKAQMKEIMGKKGFFETFGLDLSILNFGKAVCVVSLVACEKIDEDLIKVVERLPADEKHFGDYTPGRYAWITRDFSRIEPFEVKGRQGFFEVDDSLIKYI